MSRDMDNDRPDHHPDETSLLEYASGALREAAAVLIATHLALCPRCRDAVAGLETLGGAMIEDLPPSPLAPSSFAAMMARLDEPAAAPQAGAPPPSPARAAPARPAGAPILPPILPRPLRDYAGGDHAGLAWRRLSPSVDRIDLPLRGGPIDLPLRGETRDHLRLVRVRAGATLPRHTHGGTEMVLVLSGGFRDRGQQFRRGDVAHSDHEIDHGPVIDSDGDCICLSVTDAPLRFTGVLGRFLNLFVRF